MIKLEKGFYTALGTPVDQDGNIIKKSIQRQVETQIAAGASGFFVLGSMGMQCAIRQSECRKAAEWVIEANRGRAATLYGVMDNSIVRVLERINTVKDLILDGVVMTTPYYFISEDDTIVNLFTRVADRSPIPVYLYDLQCVTKMKITEAILREVSEHPNIRGIKTPDPALARILILNPPKDDFTVLSSNIDIFDVVNKFGAKWNLDGMFDCTPRNAGLAYAAFKKEDYAAAAGYLNKIVALRDTMIQFRVLPSFTALMNLLGYQGFYHPDYFLSVSDEAKAEAAVI